MGELLVAREDDFFHTILVREKLDEWGSRNSTLVQYPRRKQELEGFTYRTFTGEDTAILHIKNNTLLNLISGFDFSYWDIVLYTEQQWTPSDVLKGSLGERLTVLPIIYKYQDKQDFFIERIKVFKFEKGIRHILLRNLIREPGIYETVMSYLQNKEDIITLADLQYILGDVDLYNLEEFLVNTLYGIKKRKTVWMLDYFINTRGYSGHWIYNKLREFSIDVGYLYTMHRNGVFNRAMTYMDYQTRSKAVGATVKEGWYRFTTQEVILEQYKEEGQAVLNKRVTKILTTKVQTDNDLYGLVTGLVGIS